MGGLVSGLSGPLLSVPVLTPEPRRFDDCGFVIRLTSGRPSSNACRTVLAVRGPVHARGTLRVIVQQTVLRTFGVTHNVNGRLQPPHARPLARAPRREAGGAPPAAATQPLTAGKARCQGRPGTPRRAHPALCLSQRAALLPGNPAGPLPRNRGSRPTLCALPVQDSGPGRSRAPRAAALAPRGSRWPGLFLPAGTLGKGPAAEPGVLAGYLPIVSERDSSS